MKIKVDIEERYVRWVDLEKKRIGASSRAEVLRRMIDICHKPESEYMRLTGIEVDDG